MRNVPSSSAWMSALLASLLTACGGGGGSASPAQTAASSVTGTVATGAALVGGVVSVVDRSGASACTNAPVTTDASGAYTCVLGAASQAPMVVVVTDPSGLVSPLVSLVGSKPAAGAGAQTNVTPLTTAIAAQLDVNKDPLAWLKNPAALAELNAGTLDAVTDKVVTQLAGVLQSVGVDAATFDPFTTPFAAGSGQGADAVLDQVRVSFVDGVPYLLNVLTPDAPAVPMAGVDTTTPASVSVSAVATAFAISELDVFKSEMERCFAVPSAERAPSPDTVNRRLAGVAAACQNFVASVGDAPNVTVDFLNNGYDAASSFYSLFTSADMDGASVNRPELMRFEQHEDGQHEAYLNIKFVDKNGYPGNRILLAKKFPGSRAQAESQWWLIGNQRPLDAYIRPAVVHREQTIAQSVLDESPFFDDAVRSRVEVGLQIYVYRPNNGDTVVNPNNPNNAVRYVRVTGPGLPTGGVVMADVSVSEGRSDMSFLNTTGSIPATASPQQAENSGDIFRLQRTRGIGDAATLRTNPAVAENAISSPNWAHPLMYGQTPSSDWQADLSAVVVGAEYTFEAFCTSPTVPCHTFAVQLPTSLVPAMSAVRQPWASLTAAARGFLTDGAAATSTVNVAWSAPTLLEQVASVYAQGFNPTLFVDGSARVAAGSTNQSVTANAGRAYPAIALTDNQTHRAIRLQYVVLDGSHKEQWMHYN